MAESELPLYTRSAVVNLHPRDSLSGPFLMERLPAHGVLAMTRIDGRSDQS